MGEGDEEGTYSGSGSRQPPAATPEAPAGPMPAHPDAPTYSEGSPKRRRPRHRRRVVLIVVIAVIVLLVGGSFATAEYTSRTAFCDSCHEMEPYFASWETSAHAQAECVDCHIPPGVVPFLKTKLLSFREIWVHITGTPTPPLAVTREIPDSNCLSCHPDPDDTTLDDAAPAGVPFSHDAHADENCVDCHVRLVHRTVNPPDYVPPAQMSSCLACHDGTTAPNECSYCHKPPHEPRGECSNCHDQESWAGALARHPFPLLGTHAGLTCIDCHVSKPGAENIAGTELPRAEPACVSCHQDEHGGLTDCAGCHTPQGWKPATFRHPQVGEHMPSGEHRLDCADCHPSGFGSNSCSCHGGTPGGD